MQTTADKTARMTAAPRCVGNCNQGRAACTSPHLCQPDWPFGELTQDQRLNKAKQEARMRADAMRGLPSCFGELA
jgi:hypothetical protein